jgi:hypothetical protein
MSSSSPRFGQRAQTPLRTTKIAKNTEMEFDELSRNVIGDEFHFHQTAKRHQTIRSIILRVLGFQKET